MAETKQNKFRFKAIYAVIAIVVLAAGGLTYYLLLSSYSSPMTMVAAGDNVSVYYTLSFTNGTVFQSNFGGQPFSFIAGSNSTIPGFDNAVLGMKVDQTKNVTVPPAEAYGDINPNLIIIVNRSVFGNQSVKVGETVASVTQQYGTVTAVNATKVIINFNSPLAGQTLVFEIKVLSINK